MPDKSVLLTLSELRSKRGLTQSDIAEEFGTTQSAISRLEHQDDFLVSTLQRYVKATGGELQLLVVY